MKCMKCGTDTYGRLCAVCKGERPAPTHVEPSVDYAAAEDCAIRTCAQCPFCCQEMAECNIDGGLVTTMKHEYEKGVDPACPLKDRACYVHYVES